MTDRMDDSKTSMGGGLMGAALILALLPGCARRDPVQPDSLDAMNVTNEVLSDVKLQNEEAIEIGLNAGD